MSERNPMPPGYENNVTVTRSRDGRLAVNWPEGARGTVISRELLDDMVEKLNERLWIAVTERLPEHEQDVLVWHGGCCDTAKYVVRNGYGLFWYDGWGTVSATHWMPLPPPPQSSDKSDEK